MPLPLVTVSHSGKQHSYHTAHSLLRLGALDAFFTSSYVSSPFLQNYFTQKKNRFFQRRFLKGLSAPFTHSRWDFELKEFLIRKYYGKGSRASEAVYERDLKFDAYMATKIGKRPSQVFWGFQGSCFQSLQAAKDSGKLALCELATAHVVASRRILGEEKNLHPDWADSLDNLEFPAHYLKRLEAEPHQADFSIAASRFTEQTLLEVGISKEKIIYLPLGLDLRYVPYKPKTIGFVNRPLRLLFAGTLTQRKGLVYLFEALKRFSKGEVELHCIGGIQGSGKGLKPYEGLFKHIPAISQYELFEKYKEYDALVLPSVFEGFGLVIVEAMAAGLPVIATPHTMGPEVIISNENGYLVPIRDIDALYSAISKLRSLNEVDYIKMSTNAHKSVLAFTWDAYLPKLEKVLASLPLANAS